MRLKPIMHLEAIVLMAALIFSTPSHAEEVIEHSGFTANDWTTGLHMTAGLGVNSTYIETDLTRENVGIGLNIHTDVGYYFLNSWAFETSVNVTLNRATSVLIWDTAMTLGLRSRLPPWLGPDHSTPYFRLVGGRGPSVLIFNGQKPEQLKGNDGERTQIESNIWGGGYGFYQNARDGSVWFVEFQGTVHRYRKIEVIDDIDQVPEVIESYSVDNNAAAYSINLTFGVLIF